MKVPNLSVHLVCLLALCCVGTLADSCLNNTSPCSCEILQHGDKIKINCSAETELTEIPEGIPSKTAVLDFSNNRLKPNSIGGLCSYGFLEDVNLAWNHLTHIPTNALKKCYITRRINFTGNTFEVISKESMVGLEITRALYGLEARNFTENSLTYLWKHLNDLEIIFHQEVIPPNLFGGLLLHSLSIEFKEATSFPVAILDSLASNLRELQLKGDFIHQLWNNVLHNLEHLEKIVINLPALHVFPENLFQSSTLFETLHTVFVIGVRRVQSGIFSNLEGLRHIQIKRMESIPSRLFDGLFNLETLDISQCHVTTLPRDLFADLRNLRSLSLRDTELMTLSQSDLKSMTSLTTIDISHNAIRDMDQYLFFGIDTTVEVIDISHNHIKIVPTDLFQEQSTLRRLYLNNNNIYMVHKNFFQNLPSLEELHLQNNKLYQLPETVFVSNTLLKAVNLASNVLFKIPSELFSNNKLLTHVNLADNQLEYIPASEEFNTQSLLELNVEFNPLQCHCDLFTLQELLPNANLIGHCQNVNARVKIQEFFKSNLSCLASYLEPSSSLEASEIPTDVKTFRSVKAEHTYPNNEQYYRSVSVVSNIDTTFPETSYYSDYDIESGILGLSSKLSHSGYTHLSRSISVDYLYGELSGKESKRVSTTENATYFDGSESLGHQGLWSRTRPLTEHPLSVEKTANTSAISPTLSFPAGNGNITDFKMSENNDNYSKWHGSDFYSDDVINDLINTTSLPTPETAQEVSPAEESGNFYLALTIMVSVTLVCALILAFVFHRKRQSNIYEVSEAGEMDIDTFLNNQRKLHESSVVEFKDVPSIQIESVDDDGNVNVETYVSKTT